MIRILAFSLLFLPVFGASASGIFALGGNRNNLSTEARADKTTSTPQLAFPESIAARCENIMGIGPGAKMSVVMVADPGTFSGTPENWHYIFNLKEPRTPAMTFNACADVTLGRLLGQDAAIITSGIGPVAAGLCVQELLQCASVVKEIIYVGTSGWSPQRGGVLSVMPYTEDKGRQSLRTHQAIDRIGTENKRESSAQTSKEGCSSANPSRLVNRIGDMCISAYGSVNWACKMTTYSKQCDFQDDLCYLPAQESGPDATQLYGKCEFSKNGTEDALLADELRQAYSVASANRLYPKRKDVITSYEADYWESMRNGTGVSYAYSPSSTPNMNSGNDCMEIDAQFFYTGVPWEMASRLYVAHALNKAGTGDGKLDMTKVTAVSAMEAIGLDDAIIKYNANQTPDKKIPSVNFRGMSDPLHNPVMKMDDGRWVTVHMDEPVDEGYKFAIATTATTVLELFKQRCLNEGGKASMECSYTIDY